MTALVAMLLLSGPKDGRWTLGDGTKVSFVMVRPKDKVAWRPDGSPVNLATVPQPGFPIWDNKGEDPILVAVIKPEQKVDRMPTFRLKLPSTGILDSGFDLLVNDSQGREKCWVAGVAPGKQPSRQDVAVGIANGPWQTVGSVTYQHGKQQSASGVPFSPTVPALQKTALGQEQQIFVTIPVTQSKDKVTQLIAVDQKGNKMGSAGWMVSPKKPGFITYAFIFEGTDLKTVQLQERPCEWTVMTAAYFRPASAATTWKSPQAARNAPISQPTK